MIGVTLVMMRLFAFTEASELCVCILIFKHCVPVFISSLQVDTGGNGCVFVHEGMGERVEEEEEEEVAGSSGETQVRILTNSLHSSPSSGKAAAHHGVVWF